MIGAALCAVLGHPPLREGAIYGICKRCGGFHAGARPNLPHIMVRASRWFGRDTHGTTGPMTELPKRPDRAVLAGFLAFLAVGVVSGAAVALFRVVVPAILDAHFYGSVFAASAAGLFGTLGLGLLAVFLFTRIARLISL